MSDSNKPFQNTPKASRTHDSCHGYMPPRRYASGRAYLKKKVHTEFQEGITCPLEKFSLLTANDSPRTKKYSRNSMASKWEKTFLPSI